MKLLSLVLCLLSGLFSAFAQTDVNEVIIISTNDVHGRIDDFAKMAAYVKNLKKTHRDVYVFNGGDLINGNPVVDEAEEKGFPIFDLMNSIPYDVSCLGNHEFENGEAVLQKRISQSASAYICANMSVNESSAMKALPPYHIIKTSDGTRMAIIGLTANSSNPCIVSNITMLNAGKKAIEYRWLKDSNQVLIALTHIGFKADSILATTMPELDLIVGGHSHSEIPHGALVNGTLITQAGDKLRFLGKTVLKIKGHSIIGKSFEMVPVESITEFDAAVQTKIDFYNSNKAFGETLAVATSAFNNKESMGCLKTDALQDALSLDIAFDHVRNIAYSNFPKGSITLGNIYEWDSYDYKTLRFQLSPAQVRQLIINSLRKAEEPVLFVSGITYTIHKTATGEVDSITLKNKNGLLNEKQLYAVGMNSFIACQFMKGINSVSTEMPTTSAEALIAYLKKKKKVNYLNAQRVFASNKTR